MLKIHSSIFTVSAPTGTLERFSIQKDYLKINLIMTLLNGKMTAIFTGF